MANKKLWFFLFRFFGTYLLLFLGYSIFLQITQSKSPVFISDPITKHVATSTISVLNIFDVFAETEQHSKELSFKLFVDDEYVARVIEGCNSISVIILFISFVIAFKGTYKKTILFVVIGSLSIYFVNILRIAILSYAMLHFKQYETILHDLLFPAIIYGYVILLWIFWINKFSNLNETS